MCRVAPGRGDAGGVGIGWIGHYVLSRVGDAAVANTVTRLLPFAAFLTAKQMHETQLREGTDRLLGSRLEIERAELQRIRIGTDLDAPVARAIQRHPDKLRLREDR